MSLENKVIAGAKWSALGMWGRRLISLATFAIVTRHVTAEALGLVALAAVYISFVEILSKQGIGMALVQRKELSEIDLNTAFYINLGTALFLTAVSLLLAPSVAVWLGDERLTDVIRVLALSFPINATTVAPIALQSREFDFRSQAIQANSATLISGLVAIPMAIFGYDIWALVAQALVFSIVNSVVIWIRTTWRPKLQWERRAARELTSFSLKILLSNLVSFARTRSDQLIIGIIAGPVALGLFSLGRKLGATIDSLVKAPIERVMLPAFSRIQGDALRLERTVRRVSALNALFCIPVFLGLAMVSPEAIPIAFGDNWEAAIMVCAILSCQKMIQSLFFLNYQVLISQGLPGTQTTIQIGQAIGVVIATFSGNHWGIEGIAACITVTNLALCILTSLVVSRKTGMPSSTMFTPLAKPVLAGAIMALTIWGLRAALAEQELSLIARLCLFAPAGGIAYALAIRLFSKELSDDAFEILQKIAGKKAKRKSKAAPGNA